MNRRTRLAVVVASAVALVALVGGPALYAWIKPFVSDVPPELPANPAKSRVGLVMAQPFTLEQPATHWWRKEQPQYRDGYVLVLAVDPTLVHPRQTAEPVLYVGRQTADRVNLGHESGYVVCIVPSMPGAQPLDLSVSPIFFGTADLPERVDAAIVEQELAAAMKSGASAPAAADVASATRPAVEFGDDHELRLFCSDLIAQYSPGEVDLVSGLRAPLVK